jgi:hypothetical protein
MALEGLDVQVRTPSNLLVDGMAYVDLLSRINVIANKRIASTKSKAIPDTYRGNGKDEPVLFMYHCQKTLGCPYHSDNTYALSIHEARCSEERFEELNTLEKLYECPVEGCSKSFETESALKQHQTNMHDFKPRACKVKGCDPNVLYTSEETYKKHPKDVHPSWTPKGCPIQGCNSTVQFSSAQALKNHIQIVHQISDKDVLKSHTYVRTKSYTPQACSYPGCTNEKVFIEKRSMVNHLEKVHGVAKENASDYMTLA